MKAGLVLVGALAVLSAINAPGADKPFLSPKAKAQADSLRRTATIRKDPDLMKDRPVGNARAWQLARSVRPVPRSAPSLDLVNGPRPFLSPKDPRYEAALRKLRGRQFQVAPLK